jgi:hypothetical protein
MMTLYHILEVPSLGVWPFMELKMFGFDVAGEGGFSARYIHGALWWNSCQQHSRNSWLENSVRPSEKEALLKLVNRLEPRRSAHRILFFLVCCSKSSGVQHLNYHFLRRGSNFSQSVQITLREEATGFYNGLGTGTGETGHGLGTSTVNLTTCNNFKYSIFSLHLA